MAEWLQYPWVSSASHFTEEEHKSQDKAPDAVDFSDINELAEEEENVRSVMAGPVAKRDGKWLHSWMENPTPSPLSNHLIVKWKYGNFPPTVGLIVRKMSFWEI